MEITSWYHTHFNMSWPKLALDLEHFSVGMWRLKIRTFIDLGVSTCWLLVGTLSTVSELKAAQEMPQSPNRFSCVSAPPKDALDLRHKRRHALEYFVKCNSERRGAKRCFMIVAYLQKARASRRRRKATWWRNFVSGTPLWVKMLKC